MSIVRLSNYIALAFSTLLIYWVFIFVSIEVFDFKIFRQNMTQAFALSVLGILSVLAGSVILNIMFNLTAIANQTNTDTKPNGFSKKHLYLISVFVMSLAIIFSLLYIGDKKTSQKRELYLVSSAENLIKEQEEIFEKATQYEFGKEYIESIKHDLKFVSKIEEKFPQITIITLDEINSKKVLLGFTDHWRSSKDDSPPEKVDFILSTSSSEREYLKQVITTNSASYKFSSNDGAYELYYPYTHNGKTVVIHLSKYSRYGKVGS